MPDRPNILFIFTDQQSAYAMSCAGNADLNTPAMDSLAQTGVRFENAYCTQPLCTPARASLFTGLMPHECGINANGQPIPERLRPQELGNVFQDAGYECVYGGKWHVPEIAVPEGHGFRQICGFNDRDLAGRCTEFLKQDHEKPFFLVASFDNPHNICEWARSQRLPWGPIPEVPVEDCPNLPQNFAIPPFEPEAIRIEQATFKEVHPTSRFTDEHWRQYRHAYYRLCEKVDAEIGRILEALREQGLEEDTLVVFSSDHGDGHAAHHWNQKSVLYEEVVRIPFIVSLKGVTQPGRVDSHLVSNGLDLFPTLCDYAGVDVPDGLRGRSVRPLAEGQDPADWRDDLAVTTYFDIPHYRGTQARMIRTQRYKYAVYSIGLYREQLTDLENDPGEMVNLAVNSNFRDVLQEHRGRLAQWCEETGDRFVVPETT